MYRSFAVTYSDPILFPLSSSSRFRVNRSIDSILWLRPNICSVQLMLGEGPMHLPVQKSYVNFRDIRYHSVFGIVSSIFAQRIPEFLYKLRPRVLQQSFFYPKKKTKNQTLEMSEFWWFILHKRNIDVEQQFFGVYADTLVPMQVRTSQIIQKKFRYQSKLWSRRINISNQVTVMLLCDQRNKKTKIVVTHKK